MNIYQTHGIFLDAVNHLEKAKERDRDIKIFLTSYFTTIAVGLVFKHFRKKKK